MAEVNQFLGNLPSLRVVSLQQGGIRRCFITDASFHPRLYARGCLVIRISIAVTGQLFRPTHYRVC